MCAGVGTADALGADDADALGAAAAADVVGPGPVAAPPHAAARAAKKMNAPRNRRRLVIEDSLHHPMDPRRARLMVEQLADLPRPAG